MLSKHSLLRRAHSYRLLGAIGIALVIVVFVYQPVKIEGDSMAPLLSDHELVFVNRLGYHFEPVQRSDVIVFSYPLDRTKHYIKRIVSVPRETGEMRDGMGCGNGSSI